MVCFSKQHDTKVAIINIPTETHLIVVIQGIFAILTTDTTLLVTTKWRIVILSHITRSISFLIIQQQQIHPTYQFVVAVNPHSTSLELIGNANGSGDVACENGSSKTIGAVVSLLNDFVNGLELGDNHNRAENLIFDDNHILLDI